MRSISLECLGRSTWYSLMSELTEMGRIEGVCTTSSGDLEASARS